MRRSLFASIYRIDAYVYSEWARLAKGHLFLRSMRNSGSSGISGFYRRPATLLAKSERMYPPEL